MNYVSREQFEDFKKETDDRIKTHGFRVAKIESLFREGLQKLEEEIKKSDDRNSKYFNSIDLLEKTLNSSIRKMDEFTSKQKDLNHSFAGKSEVGKINESIKTIYEELKFMGNINKNEIATVKEKIRAIDSIQNKLLELENQIFAINSSIELNKNIFNEHIKYYNYVKESSESFYLKLSNEINSTSNKIEKLKETIELMGKECSKSHKDINEKIDHTKEFLTYRIDAEVNDIFIPDVSHFVKEEDLTKLKHEINLFTLEAKNAYVKSNNVEIQNSVNAKKIDNIQLKLTQLELSNQ